MKKALYGQAGNLAELIAYQSGSIVSRELIKQDSGTVTVFAVDAGQGLSEHTAPFDAMVQILDGQAEIIIDHKPHTLTAGQAIIMPANVPHALQAQQPFKMMLIMVR